MPPKAKKRSASDKASITPSKAKELISKATNEPVGTNFTPVRDPKMGFMFANRLMTGEILQTNMVEHRPLNIENSIIFELKSEPADFLDTGYMFLSMTTRIMEVNSEGTLVSVGPPMCKRILVDEKRVVEEKTEEKTTDGKTIIKTVKEPVAVEREVLDGLCVAPQSCFGLTAFESVKVSIDHQELPDSDRSMYYHKAMFRIFLEMNPDAIKAHMGTGLFFLDAFGTNKGLSERYKRAGASLRYDLFTPLLLDSLGYFKQAAYSQVVGQLHKSELALEYTNRYMDYKILQKDVKTFRFQYPFIDEDFLPDRVFFTLLSAKAWRGSLDMVTTFYEPKNLNKVTMEFGDSTKRRIEVVCDPYRRDGGNLYWFHVMENNVDFWHETLRFMLPEDWARKGRFGLMIDLTKNHSAGVSQIRTVPQVSKMEVILDFQDAIEQDLVLLSMSFKEECLLLNRDLLGRMV